MSVSTKEDGSYYNQSQEYQKNLIDHFKSSEEFLKKKFLNDFEFVKIYKGWIPKRFNEVKDKKFSFIHIDLDLHKPITDTLEFFYPKLVRVELLYVMIIIHLNFLVLKEHGMNYNHHIYSTHGRQKFRVYLKL